jgi:ubiquitin-protein ligase
MRRLMRELKELRTSPPEGIRIQLNEESVLDVFGIIEGPGEPRRRGTLYPPSGIDASSQRVPHTKGVIFA